MHKTPQISKKRPALGQGLDALIPIYEPNESTSSERSIKNVPLESLVPNSYQPRSLFSEESLRELSESIRQQGVLQPIIVRIKQDGLHEIVSGERRWRASKMAGYDTVPVIVKKLSDSESLEIALIENLQRENLNPVDTAEAYNILIDKFEYTHDFLAKRIGKDRSTITNHLRLLRLPDEIKNEIREDRLSMGHARTLLAISNISTQLKLSSKVINRKLSVRDLEKIVQNFKNKASLRSKTPNQTDSSVMLLERNLSNHLSTRVRIRQKSDKSGKIELHFHSLEELSRLLEAIGYTED
jgi:ParB family transcriptional regulator, chromosome partitioning protein